MGPDRSLPWPQRRLKAVEEERDELKAERDMFRSLAEQHLGATQLAGIPVAAAASPLWSGGLLR